MTDSDFYKKFEDKCRGSRQVISERLGVYLPFIEPFLQLRNPPKALDLGCGRGEWLQLVQKNGFVAFGVDSDKEMLAACASNNIKTICGDAIDYLASQPAEEFDVITAFHLVEHLPFNLVQKLVKESLRVLKPAGLLILETPNPENIVVATKNFYLDPTHLKPIPPDLLVFLPDYFGYKRSKIVRLQENKNLKKSNIISLNEVLHGVSPDYAVIAQKNSEASIEKLFTAAFQKEYGLKLEVLANIHDSRIVRLEEELKKLNNDLRSFLAIKDFFAKGLCVFTRALGIILHIIKYTIIFFAKIFFKIPLLKKIILNFSLAMPQVSRWLLSAEKEYAKLESDKSYPPSIYIDMTHVYKGDLKTGVQRVVRAIYENFKNNKIITDYSICPVFLCDEGQLWHYKYIEDSNHGRSGVVVPKAEDLFLGLDLNSSVSAASDAGLFRDWKKRGTKITFVIYDLLPIKHPEWWELGVAEGHEKWLLSVSRESEKLVCISRAVMNETYLWLSNQRKIKNNPELAWFHLGADIENSQPSKGVSKTVDEIMHSIKSIRSFLMVGTIEPRKGYEQVIAAFDLIWEKNKDHFLIIVGKQGWMVDDLINTIQNHPEFKKRLIWLEGVSDEALEKLYTRCDCLIAASYGEGFGLPLIEAAQYKLPIIARDIPVFREVAHEHAFFFEGQEPEELKNALAEWLKLFELGSHPLSDNLPWLKWEQSAEQLIKILLSKNEETSTTHITDKTN